MKNMTPPRLMSACKRAACETRLDPRSRCRRFCREGFSGASIDEIAAEAGVSRQTVYNHYREKETLFMAVIQDIMDRTNGVLFSILATFPERADNLEEDLAAFAVRLNKNCICNQDAKFIQKLIATEGNRYPHLFQFWREQGPGKTDRALAALLRGLRTGRRSISMILTSPPGSSSR